MCIRDRSKSSKYIIHPVSFSTSYKTQEEKNRFLCYCVPLNMLEIGHYCLHNIRFTYVFQMIKKVISVPKIISILFSICEQASTPKPHSGPVRWLCFGSVLQKCNIYQQDSKNSIRTSLFYY